MACQWRLAFFVIMIFVKQLVIKIHSSGFATASVNNINSFVHEGPAEVAVVQNHMRGRRIATIFYFVVNFYNRFAQRTRNRASQFQRRAKDSALFDDGGYTHIRLVRIQVRLNNRFKICAQVAYSAVKTPLTGIIVIWSPCMC